MWSSQFHNMMYSSSKSRTHLIAQHSVHTTTITETETTRPRLKHLLIFSCVNFHCVSLTIVVNDVYNSRGSDVLSYTIKTSNDSRIGRSKYQVDIVVVFQCDAIVGSE